ncbi:MAG: aspartate aminotransferase family protein [Methylophilus sp.]|jgi:glutamate-1-semialdehyde 2,1-aminomutase
MSQEIRHGINMQTARALFKREQTSFIANMPRAQALAQQAQQHLLFGVPLHWMTDWSTPFSLYVANAQGAHFSDVDGHDYIDFCLGDTGAMFGHAPQAVAEAIQAQANNGYTTMLPTEDAVWVAQELSRRFALPYWQMAMTASDANRFMLRWARAATGRNKILIFNGCYHGTVDDVFVDLIEGVPTQRDSLLGQVYELSQFTKVIEFNDLVALELALKDEDVACVLAEPVMTNIGMVLPDTDYWQQAQAIIRKTNTLLILDETHTISTGSGGYSRAHDLQPDGLVLGKPIAGGIPCAVYGMSAEFAAKAVAAKVNAPAGHSGIGTTLTANMLAIKAMRATLYLVMTENAYTYMFALAQQLATGLREIIKQYQLPWCVTQVGARTEFQFTHTPPANGTEAGLILDSELEQIIHLYLLNRGILITPFHNMLLVCPATTQQDVSQLLKVFALCLSELTDN